MNSLTFSKGFKGPNLSAILNGPAFAINQRIAQPLLTGARKISNPRAGVNAGDDRVPAPEPDSVVTSTLGRRVRTARPRES